MKAYAGVGSRSTPERVLSVMRECAYIFAADGWTLRSGGAPGADSAFERGAMEAWENGVSDLPEIYLPWSGFEGRHSSGVALVQPQPDAYEVAERFHPAWDRCSRGARALHARNVHQILGRDLNCPDPVRFVLCWTPEAKGGGGTGQAIRIAGHYGIPVYDLADEQTYARVLRMMEEVMTVAT